MKLVEMSPVYAAAAETIRGRIAELQEAERREKDPKAVWRLRRRIAELEPLLREARELSRLTAHYYDRGITIMRDTAFDTRSSEWIGDMTVWLRENSEDNTEQLSRLRRSLRLARERELTARQRQILELYYDRGLNIPQIALKLGLNRSTVSRTLRRAKERLYQYLRYSL